MEKGYYLPDSLSLKGITDVHYVVPRCRTDVVKRLRPLKFLFPSCLYILFHAENWPRSFGSSKRRIEPIQGPQSITQAKQRSICDWIMPLTCFRSARQTTDRYHRSEIHHDSNCTRNVSATCC
jgi:hypothetical protein